MIENVSFEMSFSTGNFAVIDCPRFETAQILRRIADRIERGHSHGNVKDVGGNSIGKFKYIEKEKENG